jgi:hypothetical protein
MRHRHGVAPVRPLAVLVLALLTIVAAFAVALVPAAVPANAGGSFTGPWQLRNRHSGLCLAIYLGTRADGAPAVQVPCDDNRPGARQWYHSGFHYINASTTRCLAIADSSAANDAVAVQRTCSYFAASQNWYEIDISQFDDWVHLENANSEKCLTVYEASLIINAAAVQRDCDYSRPYNEEWVLESP